MDSVTGGLTAIKSTAGQLAQKLGYSQDEVRELYKQMSAYANNKPPYNRVDLTPSSYWVDVVGTAAAAGGPAAPEQPADGPQLLASIAVRLLEVTPTAASAEQVSNSTRTGWRS